MMMVTYILGGIVLLNPSNQTRKKQLDSYPISDQTTEIDTLIQARRNMQIYKQASKNILATKPIFCLSFDLQSEWLSTTEISE